MKKNRTNSVDELTALLKKVRQDTTSIDRADKQRLKKLISDPMMLVEAMQKLDPNLSIPAFPTGEDSCSLEEIIADNYIRLAKFAIEKLQLENAHKLKVQQVSDGGFTLYALTPEPVELDLAQFATSDYPDNKELLLEAEALQADLFMEDSTEAYLAEIIGKIEAVVL